MKYKYFLTLEPSLMHQTLHTVLLVHDYLIKYTVKTNNYHLFFNFNIFLTLLLCNLIKSFYKTFYVCLLLLMLISEEA
jgi:hypothetical protein